MHANAQLQEFVHTPSTCKPYSQSYTSASSKKHGRAHACKRTTARICAHTVHLQTIQSILYKRILQKARQSACMQTHNCKNLCTHRPLANHTVNLIQAHPPKSTAERMHANAQLQEFVHTPSTCKPYSQ